MIPLRIQIKNFISYGATQTIDFEPYNLICLSGKNGHGKSALLDALTWVLWGQARKVGGVAKADEGLVHLGQTHMMVSLDFSCGITRYRVRREYTVAAGKSYTTLDFGIIDSTDSLRPLTDKTIRATQDKIETTLGLDYDTFINSAFLRQGQSHEFSKKSAKERKDILASILGLDHFERMRRLALDKAKEAANKKEQSLALIERLKIELNEKPELSARLQQIGESLTTHATKEAATQKTLHEISEKIAVLTAQKAAVEKIEFQKQHVESILDGVIKGIREESNLYRRVLSQSRALGTHNYEDERTTLQTELQNIQIQAAKKIDLQQLHATKQEALRNYVQSIQDRYKSELEKIQLTAHTLTTSQSNVLQQMTDLEKKKMAKEAELKSVTDEITLLSRSTENKVDQGAFEKLSSALEKRKAYYHSFVSKAQWLSSQLGPLEHKKQLVHVQGTAVCPLCEQHVEDTTTLHNKFEAQERRFKHQLARLSNVIVSLKKTLIDDHAQLEALKKKVEQQKMLVVKIGELQKNKEKYGQDAAVIAQEIALQKENLGQLKQQQDRIMQEKNKVDAQFLAAQQDEFAVKMKIDVMTLNENLEKIPYNPAREKQIHEKLQHLSAAAAQQSAFTKEIALQEERKRSVTQKCTQARELIQQKKELSQVIEELAIYKTQEEHVLQLKEHTIKNLQTLLEEKELLIHQKGALEAQLATLLARENECKKEEHHLKTYSSLAEEYGAVASALSKDGIQALLIEDALPEIEHEANNLLSKLTDNQAHLTIESLRDLKSGNTKETLDIKISDAAGIRPYELFSGGEAFRIDFSLRIALSKLLARRSGTPLQTLIIDEGFGSQDEDGLAHIVDALIRIQEDFAKIIVVSHLPTLKEQFPIHFHVQKTAQGSTVTVIEQC